MTSLIPSQGRIVIAVGGAARSNGTDTCPAQITRVWGQRDDGAWTVNLTLFPDCGAPVVAPSSLLYYDEATARAEGLPHESSIAAFWPPRV